MELIKKDMSDGYLTEEIALNRNLYKSIIQAKDPV